MYPKKIHNVKPTDKYVKWKSHFVYNNYAFLYTLLQIIVSSIRIFYTRLVGPTGFYLQSLLYISSITRIN